MKIKLFKQCSLCTNRHNQSGLLCSKCRSRKFRRENPIRASYYSLKHNAKRRGIDFHLTIEQFTEFCFKTDYHTGKGKTKQCLSIDRINPLAGYFLENIQTLTVSENARKARKILNYDWSNKTATVVNNFSLLRPSSTDKDVPF